MSGSDGARVRVQLRTPGWAVEVVLEAPREPAPLEVWLPFLQQLASAGAAAGEREAMAAGKRITCAKGCGSCCRQLVAISLVEARALAKLVEDTPEPRRSEIRARFADAVARLEASGALKRDILDDLAAAEFPLAETPEQRRAAGWFSLGIACPFLENETCGIHLSRPLVCREHQVTSPRESCARLFRDPVDRAEPSMRLGPALARATAVIAGGEPVMIPLALSLRESAAVEAALPGRRDSIEMLKILLGEIGDWRIETLQG